MKRPCGRFGLLRGISSVRSRVLYVSVLISSLGRWPSVISPHTVCSVTGSWIKYRRICSGNGLRLYLQSAEAAVLNCSQTAYYRGKSSRQCLFHKQRLYFAWRTDFQALCDVGVSIQSMSVPVWSKTEPNMIGAHHIRKVFVCRTL